jgi:hypothetical protein
MQGFFYLKTPEDLLHKLEREYEKVKQNPADVDHAFNFFVTAEHLPDWLYNQDMPTSGIPRPDLLDNKRPGDFKNTHAVLRVCSHLANGGKHFHLDDPRHQSIQRAVLENTRWVWSGWVDEDWVGEEPLLRVYLTPGEVAALQGAGVPIASEDIDARWLATRVLEFWHNYWVSTGRIP